MTTVLKVEGERRAWLRYFVITDHCQKIVEMEPAIMGWNVKRVSTQGSEAWPDMSEASIVAWRMDSRGVERCGDIEAANVLAMLVRRPV